MKNEIFRSRPAKYVQTGTSLKPDTYEVVCDIAEENNISVSEVIRTVIENFVDEWANEDS